MLGLAVGFPHRSTIHKRREPSSGEAGGGSFCVPDPPVYRIRRMDSQCSGSSMSARFFGEPKDWPFHSAACVCLPRAHRRFFIEDRQDLLVGLSARVLVGSSQQTVESIRNGAVTDLPTLDGSFFVRRNSFPETAKAAPIKGDLLLLGK